MLRLSILGFLSSVLVCALGAPVLAAPPRLRFSEAEPLPKMNALFEQADGWIGADGAYSVALGDKRRLWLFSDTWVGRIRDGKRRDATIVNNSVGVQEGPRADSPVKFVVRKKPDGKAAALFEPADGHGWFWLQAGVHANKKLYLFLSQIEKTDKTGVFAFRQVGQSLGVIANPDDDPASWRLEQQKLPCTIFQADRILTFGAAAVQADDYLYLYGTDEDIKSSGRERYLVVARAAVDHIKDLSSWRFYDGKGWSADFRTAQRLVSGMASEGSVSYLPDLKQYVLVYTEGGLSDRILARTAPQPTGPWSAATVIYRCPEAGWDRKIFCYAAKAHPTLANGNELIVSYVANSFDFWQAASDARIYRPRFIRVRVQADEGR